MSRVGSAAAAAVLSQLLDAGGNQRPHSPVRSRAMLPCHTARHTSQLQRTAAEQVRCTLWTGFVRERQADPSICHWQ